MDELRASTPLPRKRAASISKAKAKTKRTKRGSVKGDIGTLHVSPPAASRVEAENRTPVINGVVTTTHEPAIRAARTLAFESDESQIAELVQVVESSEVEGTQTKNEVGAALINLFHSSPSPSTVDALPPPSNFLSFVPEGAHHPAPTRPIEAPPPPTRAAEAKRKSSQPQRGRTRWCLEQDLQLQQAVEQYSGKDWKRIAAMCTGRNSKQCRHRWHNYLAPGLRPHDPWSSEENAKLLQAVTVHGRQWAQISQLFEGRSHNALKNHYHALVYKSQTSVEPNDNGKAVSRTRSKKASTPETRPKRSRKTAQVEQPAAAVPARRRRQSPRSKNDATSEPIQVETRVQLDALHCIANTALGLL